MLATTDNPSVRVITKLKNHGLTTRGPSRAYPGPIQGPSRPFQAHPGSIGGPSRLIRASQGPSGAILDASGGFPWAFWGACFFVIGGIFDRMLG